MLRTDAEFTWVSGGYPYVGVARAGVDLSAVRIALHRTPDASMYSCGGGAHMRDSRITPWASGEQHFTAARRRTLNLTQVPGAVVAAGVIVVLVAIITGFDPVLDLPVTS